eukprot:Seg1428.2 transcript_id=Seg1428.2/GoldUCD/mRNA.D3Y31 product="hypothetical protein" protein_id=Seg1428.2/GoldUCD/D3Y31
MAGFCLILLILAVTFHGSQANNVKLLEKIAAKLQVTNVGLGTYSRSKIVGAISRQMRGEDQAAVQESLNQAIVTLALLDVGGGVIIPLVDKLINAVTTDAIFAEVANAMKTYGDPMVDKLDDLKNLDDQGLKDLLKAKKMRAIRLFEAEVIKLPKTHRVLKHIKKAKTWLKLRSAGKVIGPLFDMISIGVNGWALGTAIRDCVADAEACNPASMTAASFSIASGLVGVGTFIASLMVSASVASVLGPVGAIAGLALAITATLIELFWKPGPTQAELDRLMKEGLMRELDRISRLQLYNANKFLTDNEIERSDLYVINQGHLPKWFSQHPNVVKFGKIAANKPRKKRPLTQSCSNTVFGNAPDPSNSGGIRPSHYQCPYLVDGEELRTTRTNQPLGYGFYGFTKSARTYIKKDEQRNPPDPPYGGTILLVGTNQVQPNKLAEYDNMEANLKSLDIDTATKNGADGDFDDLVAIADMSSLDAGEKIKVRMGSGNDALNIDGRLGPFSASNVLDADLGTRGHNTLSFDAMAASSPIKGIDFNGKDGVLHFKHGTNQKQRVGIVKNVEILAASPFNDYIKMYAGKTGEGGFDFTVFKFKGRGIYEVNIADLAKQTELRHFKIVDSTDNGRDENYCTDHVPLLKLINFGTGAVANDVLYNDDKIKVYGKRASTKRSHFNKILAVAAAKKKNSNKRTTLCSGEPTSGTHPEGGKNGKVLLATIAFYAKCPIEIQATNVGGSCMMSPKKKSELDLAFFQGKKMFADFSGNVADTIGIQGADHCYLKCPSGTVTEERWINLNRGSRDKVIISRELFLDPCGVDGVTVRMIMMRADENKWIFRIDGNDDKFGANGKQHVFQGVEQIINEYGNLVIDLKNALVNEFDIYEEYSKATMEGIATITERERTTEVKNSLLQCMKEESDMSAEEKEICLDVAP